VTEAEARSTVDGRLIVRHRAVEAVEIGDPTKLGTGSAGTATQQRRVVGEYPADRTPAPYARPDLAVGTPLPTLTKVLHQEQISVYSNVQSFWRTTHTDLEVARGQGLDTTLAQGLMNACYVSELATGFFGPAWHTAGHLEVAFIAPMAPGDEVLVRGVVSDTSTQDGSCWVEAEVWVERVADGRKLAVGWVDAPVRPW
jgi:acyl dehydratase